MFKNHPETWHKWTIDEEDFIRKNAGKISIHDMVKKLNRTRVAVELRARKLGLSIRYLQREKYMVDYSFFRKLTPQLAHFIGFWWADGNIGSIKNSLAFDLNKKDKKFLQDLISQFSNIEVNTYKSKPNGVRVDINNKKLYNILIKIWEFTPHKSLTCTFPSYIQGEFVRSFIQGYFEGDGWINMIGRNIGICTGSKSFAKSLLNKLLKYGFNFSLYENRGCYILTASTKVSYDFLKWIYADTIETIVMSRKYNLYQEIKEYREEKETYITLYTLANRIGKRGHILYYWREKHPLELDKIDHNGHYFYHINKLEEWLKICTGN